MTTIITPQGHTRIDLSDNYYMILYSSGLLDLMEIGVGEVLVENSSITLPDWLADGIRELVKNKIEQENDRGA
jgi:hypothetical protein